MRGWFRYSGPHCIVLYVIPQSQTGIARVSTKVLTLLRSVRDFGVLLMHIERSLAEAKKKTGTHFGPIWALTSQSNCTTHQGILSTHPLPPGLDSQLFPELSTSPSLLPCQQSEGV